jgi:hypothetical protein
MSHCRYTKRLRNLDINSALPAKLLIAERRKRDLGFNVLGTADERQVRLTALAESHVECVLKHPDL